MNNKISTKSSLLPAWLWFWLGVYIVSLPSLLSYLIYLFQDSFAQYYTWTVEVGGENSFFELLRVINLYEIAAYIVVLVGVVSIFFPRVRGKITERKYKLVNRDENAAVQEITAFVRQYVPQIQVKANLLRTDLSAVTYPLGFRKPALGVFGKLVKLWRSDRETAEAILLHEISHIRQGDVLVLGAGSLFEKVVSYWVWIFLLLVFLPVLLYTGGAIVDAGLYLNQLGIFTLPDYLSQAGQFLLNGLLSMIAEFLTTFAVFILPLAGIWSSELLADRLAVEEAQSKEGMQKAMALLAEEKGWRLKEKIIAGATHPPASLRRYLAAHFQSGQVILFLIIFFPLMYLVKLLVLLGALIPSLQFGAGDFFHHASLALNAWAGSVLPILIAMIGWLLLWNWLEPWWAKIFNCPEGKPEHSHLKTLALGAVVPLLMALGAGVLTGLPVSSGDDVSVQPTAVSAASETAGPAPTPVPTAPGSQYKIGQVFQVGDAQVVVMGWNVQTDSPDLQGAKNKKIVRVEVAVRNNGADTIAPLISCASLKDAAGKDYHYSFDDADNSVLIDRDLPSDISQPGQKIHGTISFLVDQNSDGFQFNYIANPPLDMTSARVALTDDPSGRVSPPETLPDNSMPSDASLNQPLALKDMTFTVTRVRAIDSKGFPPEPGSRLVALDLTIKNTGGAPFKISSIFLFKLQDENGTSYSPRATATAATGTKLPQEDLAPGAEVSLSIGFELPETLKKAQLQYVLDGSKTVGLEIL